MTHMPDVLAPRARRIVKMLDAMGSATVADLQVVVKGYGSDDSHAVRKAAHKLARHGWLERDPDAPALPLSWRLSAAGKAALQAATSGPLPRRLTPPCVPAPRPPVNEPSARAPIERWKPTTCATGAVVPPRQIDVMHGPVYRPAPWAPARTGALDHMDVASRGALC
ncbi:MAG TPA: hypothetical protein PKD73_06180 [Burkholderiaceae bacterium]|nr:hypothetical protein [Burkholderiaceae bacterium]